MERDLYLFQRNSIKFRPMISTISFIVLSFLSSSCNNEELFNEQTILTEEELLAPEDASEETFNIILENDSLIISKNSPLKLMFSRTIKIYQKEKESFPLPNLLMVI